MPNKAGYSSRSLPKLIFVGIDNLIEIDTNRRRQGDEQNILGGSFDGAMWSRL